MEYFISAILGWLASWLQSNNFSQNHSSLKYLISLGSCFIVGGIITLINLIQSGKFDIEQLLSSIGVAFATSQTYYNLYFKNKE